MPGWMVVEELPENDLSLFNAEGVKEAKQCHPDMLLLLHVQLLLKALSNKIGHGMEMNGMGYCFKRDS